MSTVELESPVESRRDLGRLWLPFIVGAIGLSILAAVCYANSLAGQFVFDDRYLITRSDEMRSLALAMKASLSRRAGFLSFAINYELHGVWLPGYHLVNIAIHLAASMFLYSILRRVFQSQGGDGSLAKRSDQLAWVCAAFWLAHPLQTESVTYVIQRFESMAGMFLLAALYGLVRAGQEDLHRWRARIWCVLSVVFFLGASTTKESSVVYPVIAVAFDRIFLARRWREVVTRRGMLHLANLLIGASVIAHSLDLFDPNSGASAGLGVKTITPWEYLRTQPQVLLHYLSLCFWPDQLCLDYAWPIAQSAWQIYPAGAVILALLGVTVWLLWRAPKLGFLGLVFFATLSPTSSFMPLLDVAVEHRMYLPLACVVIGSIVLASWLVDRVSVPIPYRRGLGWGIALAALSLVSARTISRNQDYGDTVRMWKSITRANPQSYRAHQMLGVFLSGNGMLEDAEYHLREAIRIRPKEGEAYVSLGVIRMRQGSLAEAERWMRMGLKPETSRAAAHYNLGRLRELQSRPSEAIQEYTHAVTIDPSFLVAWGALASCAEKHQEDASLAKALRRIAEIDPQATDAVPRLIFLLAVSNDPAVRNVDEAVVLLEKLPRTAQADRCCLEARAAVDWARGDKPSAVKNLSIAKRMRGDAANRGRCDRLEKLVKQTDAKNEERVAERPVRQ